MGGPVTPELEAEFGDMPDSLDELQELINTKTASADGIVCTNPRVMEECEPHLWQLD